MFSLLLLWRTSIYLFVRFSRIERNYNLNLLSYKSEDSQQNYTELQSSSTTEQTLFKHRNKDLGI